MLTITTKKCPGCGRQDTFIVTDEGAAKYAAGAHVQVAFPELTADQREQLITGTCGPCWDRMFSNEEEVE